MPKLKLNLHFPPSTTVDFYSVVLTDEWIETSKFLITIAPDKQMLCRNDRAMICCVKPHDDPHGNTVHKVRDSGGSCCMYLELNVSDGMVMLHVLLPGQI